jgi:hypothetical protein
MAATDIQNEIHGNNAGEGQHHAKVLHPETARVRTVTEATLHQLSGRHRIAVALELPANKHLPFTTVPNNLDPSRLTAILTKYHPGPPGSFLHGIRRGRSHQHSTMTCNGHLKVEHSTEHRSKIQGMAENLL